MVIGTVSHANGHDGPAPMRGRDAEQGLVRHMLERARRGKGGVLLVEGEPGAGKTSPSLRFCRWRWLGIRLVGST